MKICLYPGGIHHLKMGGIKTAYDNKKHILRMNNIDFITSPRQGDYDILHIEFPSPQAVWYVLRARKKQKKIVISTHVTDEDYKNTFRFSNVTSALLKRYLSWFYSQADLLIAPSAYTKHLIEQYGVNTPIAVLSNGVHPSYLQCSTETNEKKNTKPVIGTAGFVTKRKGILTFCEVADACPDCLFQWAGSIHQDLLFNINELKKPDNLTFLGYVEDIKALYNSCDMFLFPSLEENQGIVLLEAASFRLPLIVRDLPVYEGWLQHEENCVKCTTDEEFIYYVQKILTDRQLKNTLSKNARILAEENDLQYTGKKLISYYNTLLQDE